MPPNDFDLERLAEETRPSCPFCAERLEQQTPRFPEDVVPEGRIRSGSAVLFPNLNSYAKYSSVSVYDPRLHYLPLGMMTPGLIAANLATQVGFDRAVLGFDPSARWASINANHMLPSGSSLFHPHLQGSVDPHPTTFQRLLSEVPGERFEDYLATERRLGRRHLGSTGRVEWVASFAPIAPVELRAFVPGAGSPGDLDDDLVQEVGFGMATAVNLYAEMGFESFNMAGYGAPPEAEGYVLNFRLAVRSNLRPLYRSDSTYLERLHWEGAVDIPPEDLAERAAGRFHR